MTREVRLRLVAVCAVILFGSICYFVGRKDGSTGQLLAQNKLVIRANDSVTKSVTSQADSARRQSTVLDSTRTVVRNRIKVVHDTVIVECNPTVTLVECNPTVTRSPEIARLIQLDDSTISAQKHSLALQDTLIASLRVGISLRDTRIKILEQEVTPGKIKRLITATKWIAVGAVVGVALSHK